MSRLSNRMTRKPRAASCSQNASSHSTIWAPSPMIRSIGSALASPKTLVADVDAVGAGELGRLMGEGAHDGVSLASAILRWKAVL